MIYEPKSKHNKTGYDLWSKNYDSYPNPTVAIDSLTFEDLYESENNVSVLEIGCGTGRHTKKLFANGNRITAIDVSSGMLDVARSKFEGSNVQFIHSDFMKVTSFANSPFDMALMSLVLEHFSDPQAVFQKIRAQLKVGSRLYLSEIHPERALNGILAHFVDESGEQIDLASSPHTELEIRIAAEKSGFDIEVVRTVYGNNDLSKANPKWEKYLEVPMIQQWKMRVAK